MFADHGSGLFDLSCVYDVIILSFAGVPSTYVPVSGCAVFEKRSASGALLYMMRRELVNSTVTMYTILYCLLAKTLF